jgi:hypothetical protein
MVWFGYFLVSRVWSLLLCRRRRRRRRFAFKSINFVPLSVPPSFFAPSNWLWSPTRQLQWTPFDTITFIFAPTKLLGVCL